MAKILIVDDEPLTLEMLTAFLSLIGHESIGALSESQTWDKLSYESPDAILLDIMLPDGNGLDICREMRTKTELAEVPIIMISAHAPPMTLEAEIAGATAYLMKPIQLQALKTVLTEAGL